MVDITSFHVKIFADGADRASILELADNPWIRGFTTNPTLMRKAGITDYEGFGRSLARAIPDRPFSFEVLSDNFDEMEQQALQNRHLGRERLRQDSHHRYARTQFCATGEAPRRARRQGERDRADDAGPSGHRRFQPPQRPPELHFDFCRAHCRCRGAIRCRS